MNLLIFTGDELLESGILRLEDERSKHLLNILNVQVGDELRVGMLNGGIGLSKVLEVGADYVVIQIQELSPAIDAPSFDLLVALPRPQSLKKLLQIAATLGVGRICIIGSKRVEKSYFQSSVLRASNLEYFLRLGLEQGMSTRLPDVIICRDFFKFFKDSFNPYFVDVKTRLIAHPGVSDNLLTLGILDNFKLNNRIVVAIGPEGGWLEEELSVFNEQGFSSFSLGRRVMRVENALSFLGGQIELLKCICVSGYRNNNE